MSRTIECLAEFRKVGQGCFYTATISLDSEDLFSFAYDCGSDTKGDALSTEIGVFQRSLSRGLHLLVLSHFDADHVNGLDLLLQAVGRTEYVFLPYFTPVERLLCALRFPNQPDATYYAFLADPVTFLLERGVQHIVFIGRGNGDKEAPPPDAPDGGPPDYIHDRPPKIDISEMPDDEGTRQLLAADNSAHAQNPAVAFKTDDRAATLPGLWRFLFFHREEGLRDAVHRLIAKTPPRANGESDTAALRAAGFLDAIEPVLRGAKPSASSTPYATETILAAIANPQTRKKIKNTYGKLIPTHNDVSLVLWHGPVEFAGWASKSFAHGVDVGEFGYPRFRPYWGPRWQSSSLAGTILTGDLNLKRRATRAELLRHYSASLPTTAFFALPHHGSHENFVPDQDTLVSDPTCVVSAGLRNKYGHPHLDVIERLNDEFDLPVLWSNERSSVTLRTICRSP